MRYCRIYSILMLLFWSNASILGDVSYIPKKAFIAYSRDITFKRNSLDSSFIRFYAIYQDSLIAYDRLLFNGLNTENESYWLRAKADFLKYRADYAAAAVNYAELVTSGLDAENKFNVSFESGLCYYLAQNFELAKLQLDKIDEEKLNVEELKKYIPLKILILNELEQWDNASLLLAKYSILNTNDLGKTTLRSLDSVYAHRCQPHLKSPKKAKIMNAILPGLGYIYAGKVGEGLLNTGFQLAFLGLSGLGFYQHYYFATAFAGLPLFARFYRGGRYRSEFLVEKRNYILKKNYNEKLKSMLLVL